MSATLVLIGAALGLILIAAMLWSGMLRERSGGAVLLGAVAAFYPVFALSNDGAIGLHIGFFLVFAGLGWLGFRHGQMVISGGLIAHGLFDFIAALLSHPAPLWWPSVCAGFDIAAGAALFVLVKTRKIAA